MVGIGKKITLFSLLGLSALKNHVNLYSLLGLSSLKNVKMLPNYDKGLAVDCSSFGDDVEYW